VAISMYNQLIHAKEVGDEPLMLKLKYPMVQVSVGEERVFAIPKLIGEHPETQVILLDDAFQHQSVRPDINILLTTYDKPFYNDLILPLGTLREFESGKAEQILLLSPNVQKI
jgi:tetraacyldisaccharide 4'-kinase